MASPEALVSAPLTGGVLYPFEQGRIDVNFGAGTSIVADSGGTAFQLRAFAPAGQDGFARALIQGGPGAVSFDRPFCACFTLEITEFSGPPLEPGDNPPLGQADLQFGFMNPGQFDGLLWSVNASTVLPPVGGGLVFSRFFTTVWTGPPGPHGFGASVPGVYNFNLCWDPATASDFMSSGVGSVNGTYTPSPPNPSPFPGYYVPYFLLTANNQQASLVDAVCDIRLSNYCLNAGPVGTLPPLPIP